MPLRTYNELKRWFYSLANTKSFCPVDCNRSFDSSNNICAYISDPGTIEGCPMDDHQVFRLQPDKSTKGVIQRVADRVSEKYGKELFHYCHMGKESSVIANALHACVTHIAPDFRGLLGADSMFDTQRHIEKLGLQADLPGLARPGLNTSPDQMMRPFVSRESESLGVNVWQLLVMGSLIGNKELHAKCSSDFSRHVLSIILGHAPRAATPGNKIPVRSFNAQTGHQEFVTVSQIDRPDFFIRPMGDKDFMKTGSLNDCRCDPHSGLMPEDLLHCAHLERTAKLLSCKIREVPASGLFGDYCLMPGCAYALHGEDRSGYVLIEGNQVTIHVTHGEEDSVKQMPSTDDWNTCISQLGVVVLPMIFRPCAAVWGEEKTKVGLVLYQEVSNYNHDTRCYMIAYDKDHSPVGLPAVDILDRIIPVGTALLIKPHSPAWNELKPNFPVFMIQQSEEDTTAVLVRLNVPDGLSPDKTLLYVTVMQKARQNPNGAAFSCKTFPVHPWDLVPTGTAGLKELPFVLH